MSAGKKQPKCSRCRHHNITVPQRGHAKVCPFLTCACWKCRLVTDRTRIQRGLKRAGRASDPDGPQPSPRPEPEATTAERPLDLRSRPAGGGQTVAGVEGRGGPCCGPSGGGSHPPPNVPHFGEFGQTPPLPVLHFPFTMPGQFSSSYVCPNVLVNVPWPVAARLYSDGLCGPLMFSLFQLSAMHPPPPSEPGPPASSGLQTAPDPPAPSACRDPQGGQTK